MELEKIKQFYKLNFWMGILFVIAPFVVAFFMPIKGDLAYDHIKAQYMNVEFYFFYKIGGFISNGNSDGWAEAAVEDILCFMFYALYFINSYRKIGINYSIHSIQKTEKFFIGCGILYFVIGFSTFLMLIDDFKQYSFIYWGLYLILFFIFIFKLQNWILARFSSYIYFIYGLVISSFLILFSIKDLTLLNYQLLFIVHSDSVRSEFLEAIIIMSPLSYLAMPLFFSFNHYMTVKKLIMENTKEELPEDFYTFKFSYE